MPAVLDDVEVTIALVRDDEHTRDGRHLPGPFGITLDVRHTSGSTWPDGGTIHADVLLTTAEAIEMASRLLGYAALAHRVLRFMCSCDCMSCVHGQHCVQCRADNQFHRATGGVS